MAILGTHVGSFYYQAEASYGVGLPATGQQEIPSDSVTSCTITPSMNTQRLPTINDYDMQDTIQGAHDYTVNLEYNLQGLKAATQHLVATCLEYYSTYRTAGDLLSIAGVLKTSAAVWLYLKGGKVNTETITFAMSQPVTIASELWFNNLTTSATLPTGGTPAGAILTAFETYNGSIFTRSGKWLAGLKGATLTINNNLERIPKINTSTAQGGDYAIIMPGVQEIQLTADVIADAGGKLDVDDLLADPQTQIILASGASAGVSMKWALTNPTYNSQPVVYNADMTTLIISANMGAESVAFAAV
jgi:hypothetical protein